MAVKSQEARTFGSNLPGIGEDFKREAKCPLPISLSLLIMFPEFFQFKKTCLLIESFFIAQIIVSCFTK